MHNYLVGSRKIANFATIYIVTEPERGRKTETFIINDINKKTYNNMKKRLLLFAAVLTASANFMFAENKTVKDSNGNTFSYDTQTDLDPSSYEGQVVSPIQASISPNGEYYTLTINSDQTIKISDRNIIYNVKLAKVSDNAGTIGSFTERLSSENTVYDIGVTEAQLVSVFIEDGVPTSYSMLDVKGEVYKKYQLACERAIEINPALVIKGEHVPSQYDFEEMEINSNLYYMISGKKQKTYKPILNVNGTYSKGITYSNSFITYNPVGIVDGYKSYTVDGEGKVGHVHGVVDDGKVEEILANDDYKYLNFDFTNVSVLGSVATDIEDNRIAYFARNTDATGQNIVVGSTCESYVISDILQEIFVSNAFQATNSQYKRTITSNIYGTIVLPFAVENTSNVFEKQAKLTGYTPSPDNESLTTNKLTFTSTEMIAPNTPYLFKSLSTVAGESILFGNINGTVNATTNAASANFNGAQFVGTFEGVPADEIRNYYVINTVNGVGKIGKTSKALKPGRCYLSYKNNSVNAKVENATIEIVDEDGSVENVILDEAVTAIDGVVNGEVVSIQYISVDGQISNEPFSGINLVKKTFEDGSVETTKVVF